MPVERHSSSRAAVSFYRYALHLDAKPVGLTVGVVQDA